jgi:hypothetical protein
LARVNLSVGGLPRWIIGALEEDAIRKLGTAAAADGLI